MKRSIEVGVAAATDGGPGNNNKEQLNGGGVRVEANMRKHPLPVQFFIANAQQENS